MWKYVVLSWTMICAVVWGSPNGLDASFGTKGKAFTIVQNDHYGGINAITIHDNGKIYVAGTVATGSTGSDRQFGVACYGQDGKLDSNFGFDGTTIIDDFRQNQNLYINSATSITQDSAGKLVIAGISLNRAMSPKFDFALVRISEKNGTKDISFGERGDGIVITDIWGGDDLARGIAVQKNKKIVVAGTVESRSGQKHMGIVRYEDNGSLDGTFGSNSIAELMMDGSGASAVAIQEDGKIVAAGWGPNAQSGNPEFRLLRLLESGAIDESFGNDGNVTTSIGSSEDHARALAIQKDGKYVVAGWTNRIDNFGNSLEDMVVVRYKTDGAIDTTFGTDGIVRVSEGNNSIEAHGVAVQNDGKIVVVGFYEDSTARKFMITRLLSDGRPDTTFGPDGRIVTDVGANGGAAYGGVAIQNDGKSIAAGSSDEGNGEGFTMLRYDANGMMQTVLAPLYYLLQ